jgi:predicted DNA-binding protein (MmcQ/YjbR family)
MTEQRLAHQLERIRAIALSLPEATEEITWGESNFRIRKKIFCFPGRGGSLMVKADPEELGPLLADPRFRPAPYLAKGGWVITEFGDGPIDWTEVEELIVTSYCLIAPKKLAAPLLPSAEPPDT